MGEHRGVRALNPTYLSSLNTNVCRAHFNIPSIVLAITTSSRYKRFDCYQALLRYFVWNVSEKKFFSLIYCNLLTFLCNKRRLSQFVISLKFVNTCNAAVCSIYCWTDILIVLYLSLTVRYWSWCLSLKSWSLSLNYKSWYLPSIS